MNPRLRIVAGVAALTVATVIAGAYLNPPNLLRVGANYSAKIICSNVFLASRAVEAILHAALQAPGDAPLTAMRARVDHDQGIVRAGFFGLFGQGLAVHRPGTGCTVVPDGQIALASAHQFKPSPIPTPARNVEWPLGASAVTHPEVAKLLADDTLPGPGFRAVAVIHKGKLVGERYVPGFTADTPLLGWSMTKTVTAALIGLQVGAGKTALERKGLWPTKEGDGRDGIALTDLLSMTPGLRFNEGYGSVSDVTRMLYLEPDMAAYARSMPLDHPPGTTWNYASGTTLILSRLWQDAVGASSLAYPHEALFMPLGMSTAVIEADARGTYVGSSYMYASAQDWARFGQFLLQDGVWNGQRLLPEGFVASMQVLVPASQGHYGAGQTWRTGPNARNGSDGSEAKFDLPKDTYWMSGHDGQTVAIIPSRQLVVVRLGLTPSRLGYQPQALLAKLVHVLN